MNVPVALVTGFCKNKDLRILEIENHTLKLESEVEIEGNSIIDIMVFDFREYRFETFPIQKSRLTLLEKRKYSYLYRAEFDTIDRENMYFPLLEEIKRMMHSQKWIDDEEKEQKETSPKDASSEENTFFNSYGEQERYWYTIKKEEENEGAYRSLRESLELAFLIDNQRLYKQFATMEWQEAVQMNLKEKGLEKHGIFAAPRTFSRIYIGSEFCPHLFPRDIFLFELLEKALQQEYEISVALPYLRENDVKTVITRLNKINRFCNRHNKEIEVVINDWGLPDHLKKEHPRLKPVLGRLLNKRTKDPRIIPQWNRGKYKVNLEENYLNNGQFKDYIAGMGITRCEFEHHTNKNRIPAGKHSLHFPFFQMNTSQYCPLYAACKNYSKYIQELPDKCPHYCSEFCYLYPADLNLLGKGNSIMGFNIDILKNSAGLEEYIRDGIDRLVYTM